MICIMDLFLKMPEAINKGDPREIVEYIEGLQREEKKFARYKLEEFIMKYGHLVSDEAKDTIEKVKGEIK